jgi:hypothetical protein
LETELEACLSRNADCIGAGYVDLASGFMLALSSDPPMHEEARELLAVAAVQAMGSTTATEVGQAVGNGSDARPVFREAVIMSPEAIYVFQRLENAVTEALCLIFRPEAVPTEVLDMARTSLARIAKVEVC